MSRLERIRLTRQEAHTAQMLGTPPVLFFKILIKILWKMKRWLSMFLLISFVAYGVSTISASAVSPKIDLTQPIVAGHSATQQEQIVDFINQTFGKDAPNALRVAKCESGLNPRAVNDNTTWGGVGQDRGLFQLNNVYQKIDNADFLFDYKINTLMAKEIFDKWGHNFQAWTCGKHLGL